MDQFTVQDTIKIKKNVYGHIGRLESGSFRINQKIKAQIDIREKKSY